MKRLQHSYQQHSYQEITALLSADYNTPDKRLQHFYQQIIAKHNKNARIFKFPMRFTCINFFLYFRTKRCITLLKMAEELISNLGYETPQSDTKRQKLLECVLTGNSKLYLGKVCTEDQLKKLDAHEVENYEAKLSGQMVKSLGHFIINMYSMGLVQC